ncbi:hypothetical protein PF001_g28548 [Phytophthora fragariae]|uniref:RxLR effector protein n=1 Tax=Phytophthora fragariae TaxID=53985 RepID=A0A6A4BE00_9STRA|nr:hypothetical protein PF006_g14314 [Phytophthora fragariae]KAE9271048.1 hypothetical protein PF001_g28548 [Phytophthora fragariae]
MGFCYLITAPGNASSAPKSVEARLLVTLLIASFLTASDAHSTARRNPTVSSLSREAASKRPGTILIRPQLPPHFLANISSSAQCCFSNCEQW